jgi:YD repeat-containing protein
MNSRRAATVAGGLLIALALSAPANAGIRDDVQLGHDESIGNFILTSTDFAAPSSPLTRIERIYQSKSSHTGWFGFGWGSRYETSLEFEADGSILAKDYGGGSETTFIPQSGLRPQSQIVAEVIAAANQTHLFGSDAARTRYALNLRDKDTLKSEWTRYRNQGLIEPAMPPVGEAFYDSAHQQKLERVPEGFQRQALNKTFSAYGSIGAFSGEFETFDLNGLLIRIWDSRNNFVAIRYTSKQQPKEIYDNYGKEFLLAFNNNGSLARVRDASGRVATYEYRYNRKNPSFTFWGNDLARYTDINGNVYTYDYDGIHDLTRVQYPDHSSMRLAYDGQTGRVAKAVRTDGRVTTYTYGSFDSHTNSKLVSVHTAGGTEFYVYLSSDDGSYVQEVLQSDGVSTSDTLYDSQGAVLSAGTTKGSVLQMPGKTAAFYSRLGWTFYDNRMYAESQAAFAAAQPDSERVNQWRPILAQIVGAAAGNFSTMKGSANSEVDGFNVNGLLATSLVKNCYISQSGTTWQMSCTDAPQYVGRASLGALVADLSAALPQFTRQWTNDAAAPRWESANHIIVTLGPPTYDSDDWSISVSNEAPVQVSASTTQTGRWREFFNRVLPAAPENFAQFRGVRESSSAVGTLYKSTAALDGSFVKNCMVASNASAQWAFGCIDLPAYIGKRKLDQLAADVSAALPSSFVRSTTAAGIPRWNSGKIAIDLIAPRSADDDWAIEIINGP